MPVLRQTSFVGGEVSPEFYARTDLAKYHHALRTCRNFIVTPTGPLVNRPGTEFVAEAKKIGRTVRLVPFRYSDDQTFVIEFGHDYVRFLTDGAPVVVGGASAWSSATVYAVDDYVSYDALTYRAIQAGTNQQPDVSPAYWTQTNIYEMTAGILYSESHLSRLKFAQSGDSLYITHPNYFPAILKRVSNTDWTLTSISWGLSWGTIAGLSTTTDPGGTTWWTWRVVAYDANGVPLAYANYSDASTSTTGAAVVLGWTAYAGAASYDVYRARGGSGTFGRIGSSTTNEFFDDGQEPDYLDTPPEYADPFVPDNPAVCSFHEQRLVLANTETQPNGIWASEVGNFTHFSPPGTPPLDANSVTIKLASRKFEEIRSLLPHRVLLAIGVSAHWSISGAGGDPLTPSSIEARPYNYVGASWLDPLPIGHTYLFVPEKGALVREVAYSQEAQGYTGSDLALFSSHLFRGFTIADWDYARDPYTTVWAARSDGVLLGLTYQREHDVLAWHRHTIGGDGVVENVCCVAEGTEDAVYLVVRRTINGATKRYIERMATRQVDDVREGVFLDSSVSYDGRNTTAVTMTLSGASYAARASLTCTASSASFVADDVGKQIYLDPDGEAPIRLEITGYTSSTIVTVEAITPVTAAYQATATADWGIAARSFSGLDHLEGEEVYMLGDGYTQGPFTVTSGAITADRHAVIACVGLNYTPEGELLDLAVPGAEARALEKNVYKANLEVVASRGLWVGEDTDSLVEWQQRDVSDSYGRVGLATQLVEVRIEQTWNKGGRILFQQRDPLPLQILSVTREFEVGGS